MVSLVGLHRFVGPSANRDPKRSHSRGPGDGRWLPWRNDGRWYRPKILRKTQNTKHFNTSTLPVLGHKKEWHTQKDTLGPAIFVPPPKKKKGRHSECNTHRYQATGLAFRLRAETIAHASSQAAATNTQAGKQSK